MSIPVRRLRRRWLKFLIVLMASVLAGIACEIILAVVGVSFPRPYIPDPHIGTRLQPGLCAWFGKEGGAWVCVNESGFRDDSHAIEADPDTLRIAVLGDSYVEAAQVALEDTFWKVLETRLSKQSKRNVEVMGFGISGFGTAQELLAYRHYARNWKPDIVILAMTPSNDIRNNSSHLEPVQERPFFKLVDGNLIEDRGFLQHPAFLLANQTSSRIKTWMINASRTLQLAAELKQRPGNNAQDAVTEQGLDDSIFKPPVTPAWQEAWDVTEALIRQLHEDVTADGAVLVVVTLTSANQVPPDEAIWKQNCIDLGTSNLTYAEDRIADVCRESGIPVLTLAAPMRSMAVEQLVWFHGFPNTAPGTGHWNVHGHQVAGRLIAEFLQKLGY
ncbi:MAG: SGNH/GDSL hydrolase family protein [Planctomycetaceae bacterium]